MIGVGPDLYLFRHSSLRAQDQHFREGVAAFLLGDAKTGVGRVFLRSR